MNPALQTTGLKSAIDHLVVVAHSLAQGVEWCSDTFGVVPGPGGCHSLMATHNRLIKVGAPGRAQAYLEIIAIDPDAQQAPSAGRARWFGIDDPALQQSVARVPRLVHFVASTSDLPLAVARLAALGEDVGEPVAASRSTPEGELRWQITLRGDGMPQHGGALPALIAWQGSHPTETMNDQGIRLRTLRTCSDRPQALRAAMQAISLDAVETGSVSGDGAALEAVFEAPRGVVTLRGGFPRTRPGS